jgi:hypothetical protein
MEQFGKKVGKLLTLAKIKDRMTNDMRFYAYPRRIKCKTGYIVIKAY